MKILKYIFILVVLILVLFLVLQTKIVNKTDTVSPQNTITDIKQKSGITGTVTLGPTCPVERIPPDPNCAPKFYSTSINIMRAGDNKIIKTIQSDSNGVFRIDLDQGSYILQAQGGNVLPRCPLVTADVKSGQYITANISCDTGIR